MATKVFVSAGTPADESQRSFLDAVLNAIELAVSTQVLLFTHHRRVLELASALGAKAGIFAHELV